MSHSPTETRLIMPRVLPGNTRGEFQIIGMETVLRERILLRGGARFGLARYSLPSGRVLNRVSLDVLPTSHPSWFPDHSSRVLYAGNDGKLYRIDFDGKVSGKDPLPRRIAWKCAEPGENLLIRDPVWLRDPQRKWMLVVSLTFNPNTDDQEKAEWTLWWLRLERRRRSRDLGRTDQSRWVVVGRERGTGCRIERIQAEPRRDSRWQTGSGLSRKVQSGLPISAPTRRNDV